MSSTSLKIIVSGMIAAGPYPGGATCSGLQYALGLQELGHRVLLMETIYLARLQSAGVPLIDSMLGTDVCTDERAAAIPPKAMVLSGFWIFTPGQELR